MKHKFTVKLNCNSIDDFIKTLEERKKWLNRKRDEICEKLATYGVTSASLKFARSIYTGKKDFNVTMKKTDNGYKVIADGESVLFIEFGAGATYGYGHPDVQQYGPGTYPNGKGHWNDPKGWYLPKDKGGYHTFGNPPNAPMYNTLKELEEELPRIIKEVLSHD